MTQLRACPVVLRHHAGEAQILVFRHPDAGLQLVKGRVEPGETTDAAALRELSEESGLRARDFVDLGSVDQPDPAQLWHVVLCQIDPAPDYWIHPVLDDGGHLFSFSWHPLRRAPSWHPMFERVRQHVLNSFCLPIAVR